MLVLLSLVHFITCKQTRTARNFIGFYCNCTFRLSSDSNSGKSLVDSGLFDLFEFKTHTRTAWNSIEFHWNLCALYVFWSFNCEKTIENLFHSMWHEPVAFAWILFQDWISWQNLVDSETAVQNAHLALSPCGRWQRVHYSSIECRFVYRTKFVYIYKFRLTTYEVFDARLHRVQCTHTETYWAYIFEMNFNRKTKNEWHHIQNSADEHCIVRAANAAIDFWVWRREEKIASVASEKFFLLSCAFALPAIVFIAFRHKSNLTKLLISE